MSEHPVKQPIRRIFSGGDWYTVGFNGVTRIEATTKSGMYADIPYIRVWGGDKCLAEFCQHSIDGVYFEN